MIDFPAVGFTDFHERTLPQLLASGNGVLAAADVDGAAPIGFVLPDGRGYSYVASNGTIEILAGTDRARTVVELSEQAFSDLAQQIRSAPGLLFEDELTFRSGEFDRLVRWEPALRAMYAGRPIYDAAAVDLTDRRGDPLALERSFTLDDPHDEIAHFFSRAGFVVLRDVFEPPEISELNVEIDRLAALARPGDGRSWWAMRGDEEVLCRLVYVGDGSSRIRDLDDDSRVADIVALSGYDLVNVPDRMEGQSVVIKVPGATAGLADLPWHQDCGLGGHPVLCPAIGIGVQLDRATPESGQLHFLAGSQGMTCHQFSDDDLVDLPHVAVSTGPGDVTLHTADVMHAAPPPAPDGRGRRTLYTSRFSPEIEKYIGPGEAYNDRVRNRRDDGQAEHVDQIVG